MECYVRGCQLDAIWECTCELKVYTCKHHYTNHFRECRKNAHLIEDILYGQLEKVISADNSLKQLENKIVEERNSLIFKINEACEGFFESIHKKREILKLIQFGREFDENTIKNINSTILEFDLKKFTIFISENFKICELKEEVSKSVEMISLQNKKEYLKSIGVKLPMLIEEILFTNDKKLAFICNKNTDRNIYPGS